MGRKDVPYRIAALASFTSYPIAHGIGAVALISPVIRYRIYSRNNVGALGVANICFLTGLTFWLGNMTALGFSLLYEPTAISVIDHLSPGINRLLALPPFLLVLVIIAGFGTGESVIVIAVAAVYAPSITRVIRSATQVIRPREFVLVARARGDSLGWITLREIAPNIVPTLLVEIALRLTFAVMFIASLSFLGLGVQPPSPNWGVMVAENRDLLFAYPLAVLVPAAAIAVLAISVNLIADAITVYFGGGRQGQMR